MSVKQFLPRTTGVLWLGVVLFFLLSIFILLPIQPNDFWWYLRLGKTITTAHIIPSTDSYTFTRAGQPIIYHSWLSAVVMWGAYHWGGPTLTVLLRAMLLAVFYVLIWQTCRLAGAGPRLAALLMLLAALAGSNNWAMRPQLFSYPLFALTLLGVWQWRRGKIGWLWVLPFTMALWVNLHGAFVLGFLLVGAALVGGGGNRRALAIALTAMALATLINPRGMGAWGYVWALLTDPASQHLGAEWHPLTVSVWQGWVFLGWLLALPLATTRAGKTLSATDWLWFLGFGGMALTALRYVIWFAAVLAPLTGVLLTPTVGRWVDRRQSPGIPALNGLLLLMLLALPLTLLPGVRERWWQQSLPVLSPNTPVQATEWLATHPELPGPLWSDLAFSSYLIYALPERPVWIDTRFELFPLEHWEQYRHIAQARFDWEYLLTQNGIRLLLLDPKREPALVQAVGQSLGWAEVYRDTTAVIFTRMP